MFITHILDSNINYWLQQAGKMLEQMILISLLIRGVMEALGHQVIMIIMVVALEELFGRVRREMVIPLEILK